MFQVQLIDAAHERQVRAADRARLVVRTGSADADQPDLPGNRQGGGNNQSFPCAQKARLAERAGQKIILQRQLADLCVKRFQVHWRLIDRHARRAEHIGRSLLQLPLPFCDLVRMNLKLLSQFCQRALARYRRQCHLRLERRRVRVPGSLRHRLVSFVAIMPISEPRDST